MKKKVVSIMLCGAMVAALAAGCGSGSDTASTDNAGTDGAADAASAEAEPAAEGEEAEEGEEAGGQTAGEYEITSTEKFTLTVQNHDPENSATGQFLNDWAAAVNEASNGLLDIQVYHGATLGGPKDTIDMIKNGTCDIGWGLQSFYADVFPVTEVFTLPMIDLENAVQGSDAIWEFYNTTDYMDAEYADYHVLLLHTNCQSPISTTSKKIETVEDIAALQLRGNAGPPTNFIDDLSATPVSCAINDLYSNLEKGVYDGCVTDWHAISSFKLNETLSYYVDENVGVSTYFLMMNKDKYEALPDDLKAVLDGESANAIQYTDAWNEYEAAIRAEIEETQPGAIYKLSDEEHAKLQAIADQTAQDWIASMTEKGYDGQAIYDKAMECLANAK